MSAINDRLFRDYRQSPWTSSADDRWEMLLADMRRGWIRLEWVIGEDRARIVVLGV